VKLPWAVDQAVSVYTAAKTPVTGMVLQARAGISLGPDIYASLPESMTRRPKNDWEAAEQASYFLALATRRALRNDELATIALEQALDQAEAERASLTDESSSLCRVAGIGCGSSQVVQLLDNARHRVEASGLNIEDQKRVSAILKSNKTWFLVRKYTPWVALGLMGVGIGLRYGVGKRGG